MAVLASYTKLRPDPEFADFIRPGPIVGKGFLIWNVNISILMQHTLRLLRIYLMFTELTSSFSILTMASPAWTGAAYVLSLYMQAGHVS